jgi:hypothetical protein
MSSLTKLTKLLTTWTNREKSKGKNQPKSVLICRLWGQTRMKMLFRKLSMTGTSPILNIGGSRIYSTRGKSILSLWTTILNLKCLRRSFKRTRCKFRKRSTLSGKCKSLIASTRATKGTRKPTMFNNSDINNCKVGSTDLRELIKKKN